MIGAGTEDVHVTPMSRRDHVTRKANPVIVGGVVKGVWSRKGNDVAVTGIDQQRRPDAAINQEAGRLADVLGRDLQPRYTTKRSQRSALAQASADGTAEMSGPSTRGHCVIGSIREHRCVVDSSEVIAPAPNEAL